MWDIFDKNLQFTCAVNAKKVLLALPSEPSRFFLKGKVRQKNTSYIHTHTVGEEFSQVWNEHKRRRYKKQSQVLVQEFFILGVFDFSKISYK